VFALSTCDPSNFNPAVQCFPTGIDRIDGDRSSTGSGNGCGSVNVNVAVLDAGIDISHPDLNVIAGKNCSSEKTLPGKRPAICRWPPFVTYESATASLIRAPAIA